jgi:hypothetical protein
MQYLLYCVVCYRVRGAIKEVFVVDVMDATIANCRLFMQWHTHDAKVALAQYMKANGIPSPPGSDINSP